MYIYKKKYIYIACCVITIISTYIKLLTRTYNMLFTFPQADSPTGLESVVSSTGPEYDLSTQRQSIDKNVEIIIQVDPESSSHGDRNLPELNAIRSERLRDAFEVVSEEQRSTLFLADPLGISTTVRGTSNSQLENRVTEVDRRIGDRPEDKGRIARIARDREHILDNGISRSVHAGESIPDSSGSEIAGSVASREEEEGEGLDLAGNATRATVRETSSTGSRDEKADNNQFTFWTSKSNVRFSRVNEDGAKTAVALVAVGAIMLLVGPIVIVLRILDERRQARKLVALPANGREDLPPTYEQAVLMDEAPRYSTLALNYDHTPPPSPTLSSYTFPHVVT